MRIYGRKSGQTLIEYAILIGMIAIMAIAILTVLGRKSRDIYASVNDAMVTATSGMAGGAAPPPPPAPPWWQPFVKGKYDGYLAGGDTPEMAFNKAMGDLAGAAGGNGVTPGQMPQLFNDAGGWLGQQIGGP